MPTLEEVFPSKYLKASDLGGKSRTLKIAEANMETLKTLDGRESTKVVLYFHDFKKLLPLNRTNFQMVQIVTGEKDSDDWHGHNIVVYPDQTSMGGKIVDCVRIKAPKGKSAPVDMAEDGSPDDGVPFNDQIADVDADEAEAA
jgi:hypothetical protein